MRDLLQVKEKRKEIKKFDLRLKEEISLSFPSHVAL